MRVRCPGVAIKVTTHAGVGPPPGRRGAAAAGVGRVLMTRSVGTIAIARQLVE
jgi:hypothetical protein